MKKLKIKTEEEETAKIELIDRGFGVDVRIDEELIARFSNDGKFHFWGLSPTPRYEGRWDE